MREGGKSAADVIIIILRKKEEEKKKPGSHVRDVRARCCFGAPLDRQHKITEQRLQGRIRGIKVLIVTLVVHLALQRIHRFIHGRGIAPIQKPDRWWWEGGGEEGARSEDGDGWMSVCVCVCVCVCACIYGGGVGEGGGAGENC